MRETWYVLEDGSVVDPSECTSDEKGALTHKDGVKVAMRSPDCPMSRGVDVDPARAAGLVTADKDMRPGFDYLTRQPGTFDHDGDGHPGGSTKPADPQGDLTALRAQYQEKLDKRPFNGWDVETLRQKIAAAGKVD